MLTVCRTGEAKLTKGYQLPSRYVIHTVGPRFNAKYKTAAENALFSCYRSVLMLMWWVLLTSYIIQHSAPSLQSLLFLVELLIRDISCWYIVFVLCIILHEKIINNSYTWQRCHGKTWSLDASCQSTAHFYMTSVWIWISLDCFSYLIDCKV